LIYFKVKPNKLENNSVKIRICFMLCYGVPNIKKKSIIGAYYFKKLVINKIITTTLCY